jgi:pimeloyl-ACP methyl ester carboxylesterase
VESPSAPTQWLLLRGLGRERRHWFDFGTLLETTLGARCAYLDLPGVGRRRTEAVPDSMPELARSVACGWEEELQGTRPVGIVALSLGAMVALELAFEHPQTISHLVLINSSSRLSPPWARFNPRAACELTGAALTRDALFMEQLVYRWTLHRKRREAGRYARPSCCRTRSEPV